MNVGTLLAPYQSIANISYPLSGLEESVDFLTITLIGDLPKLARLKSFPVSDVLKAAKK
jgi:hypothetical protein